MIRQHWAVGPKAIRGLQKTSSLGIPVRGNLRDLRCDGEVKSVDRVKTSSNDGFSPLSGASKQSTSGRACKVLVRIAPAVQVLRSDSLHTIFRLLSHSLKEIQCRT